VEVNEEILQEEEIPVSLSLYFSKIFNHAQPDPRSGNRMTFHNNEWWAV